MKAWAKLISDTGIRKPPLSILKRPVGLDPQNPHWAYILDKLKE